jgi:hypothetical protein
MKRVKPGSVSFYRPSIHRCVLFEKSHDSDGDLRKEASSACGKPVPREEDEWEQIERQEKFRDRET